MNYDVLVPYLLPLQRFPEAELQQSGGEGNNGGEHPADEQCHKGITLEIMGEKDGGWDDDNAENQHFQPGYQRDREFQLAEGDNRLYARHHRLGGEAHDGGTLRMQSRDEDEVGREVDHNADDRRQVQQFHAAVGRKQRAKDVGHRHGDDAGDKEGENRCTFCNMLIIKQL